MQYSDLSVGAIKQFHQQHGYLMVELSPAQGQLLLSLLKQRDRIESDLLTDVSFLQLVWDYFVWVFHGIKARLFSPGLLTLQQYVGALDATHGWETNQESKLTFVLLPLNQEPPNPALGTSPSCQEK